MNKWIANITVLFISTLSFSFAKANNNPLYFLPVKLQVSLYEHTGLNDTIVVKNNRKQEEEEKKRIKQIAKTKKLPKPEKIKPGGNDADKLKEKPKRQRRPEGLDRPPEIPRRSGS